ncbi:MAG TPA: carboxypeptidase-like regulatory domain-containing protein [Thermoanaerobaculia bacterium]|jgi:hypothetical protein
MPVLLMILALVAADVKAPAPRSAIEATIRGAKTSLAVELLARHDGEEWQTVANKSVAPNAQLVRFEQLAAGIYQLRVRGAQPGEQLATKVVLGSNETQRPELTIAPFELTGSATLAGTTVGAGAVVLQHRELDFKVPVQIAADGTFRTPLWQRGEYTYAVRAAALATTFTGAAQLRGASPVVLAIDVPDGRLSGVVTDASSGGPAGGVIVALQSNIDDVEQHVRATTDAAGRFEFTGLKEARHTVRFISPQHLEPEPVVFEFAQTRHHELNASLTRGRSVPVVVVDAENTPVEGAHVFAVSSSKLCGRATTTADGKASISVPAGDPATLFVIPKRGLFAMHRIARKHDGARERIYLPRDASSLSIRARTIDGAAMDTIWLLMRFNGELVPLEVVDALSAVQGLELSTGETSEALLQNIPSGSYEFWPYRTEEEAESIVAAGHAFEPPIQVNVRKGENRIAVKFAKK